MRRFVLHKRAVRAMKITRWYETLIAQLMLWTNQNRLSLSAFTKCHLDEYLVYQAEQSALSTTPLIS